MKRLASLAGILLLVGCQTATAPAVNTRTSDAAHALYAQLTETLKGCWFAGDATFADYVYTPEVNGNMPRILLSPKKNPDGRPVLVIEPTGSTTADVYGPLLTTPVGNRVRADLGRWLKGDKGCGAA